MTTDTFNHGDRSGFLERLGRLAGTTTWREPDGSGYTPPVAGALSTDNAMLIALAMARRNPFDIGPEVAYSVGTGTPHQRDRVVNWLARKLLSGTGRAGRRNAKHVMAIADQAYDLVIGITTKIVPPENAKPEFVVLANIGAGWLWMSMEAAVERAEYAMRREGPVATA
jgi:hypothetical protein